MAMSFLAPAFALAVRYLYLAFVLGSGTGHVQSVIASGVLAVCGVLIIAIGLVAHLLGINRRLIEEVRYLTLVAQHGEGQGRSKLGVPESLPTTDVAAPIHQPHRPRETELVAGVARAAVTAGADGLMFEVHPDPARSVSDGRQSVALADLASLVDGLRPVAAAVGRTL